MNLPSQWRRDPEIQDLIHYFDEDRRYRKWETLTTKEFNVILRELERIRNDFSYAARNYFMLSTKEGEDVPFALWESQELILEKWYWLLEHDPDHAQRIMVLKARQLGAVSPDTLVLTAGLRWQKIQHLDPGDEVVSVDEMPLGGRGVGRKLRTATILDKWWVTKPAYRLQFCNGTSIVATGDHPFLCQKRGAVHTEWRKVNDRPRGKKSSSPIVAGDRIRYIATPWKGRDQVTRTDWLGQFEDGWFAGLLDGEGSLRAKENGGIELSVSQVAGDVLERAKFYLESNGYNFRLEVDNRKSGTSSKLGNQPVYKLVLHQMPQIFEILGRLRPSRMVNRRVWEGKDLPSNGSWLEVASVEDLGPTEMVDIRTSTGTFIGNGLVTHNCSTVIEGLIAWSVIFFSNRNAMVVSNTDSHAAYLFGMMQHFYDNLPWWLQPMVLSRKFEQGLIFANSNYEEARFHPGNKSQVLVQSAKQTSGVGQGIRLNAVHLSEYADWEWDKFKEIINGDMIHALADNRNSFAFLESTGKGAGSPGEEMWTAQVQLMERGEAKWVPLFIPWFFEKKRVLPPEAGWRIQQPELDMRERVEREWVRCSNCNQFFESVFRRESRIGKDCPECAKGKLEPYELTDRQLRFMQRERTNAELEGVDSIKKLREELATTAEEAWQLSGIQVFPDSCHVFVNNTIGPPMIMGDINDRGEIHYVADYDTGQCGVTACRIDHRWDMEHPLQIWKLPDPRYKYSVGVDVAEGMSGKADYSVIFVTKLANNPTEPDEQVCVWRSNTVDPIQLASPCNFIGRMYNDALMSIEVNKYDTCFNTVRLQFLYPNIFVWKHYDSKNPMSNKLGWFTNLRSKPMLWQTAVRWLKSRMWIIRSSNFAHEMKRFQKDDYDDQRASAERNFHDDELMAGMISLFCAHDMDYSEDLSYIPVKSQERIQTDCFTCTCDRCKNVWVTENPRMPCPRCNCMLTQAHRETNENVSKPFDFNEMINWKQEDLDNQTISLWQKMNG